ncbi:hypothetical protein AUP42_05540 [Thalassospira lucentensis]|uniref:Uncharacterized protein n=1 Tax=Thalassospira lucentensis TaxID=168935 RepID=A0A154L189_9PROT|nr:hypothetical protein [Thalassospira lucentensis]KZB61715.1 hypothetical protein AUP42_05540 [Thalassospira lucentensis]
MPTLPKQVNQHDPRGIPPDASNTKRLAVLQMMGRDACTNEIIFFAHPAWHFGFDTVPEQALANRQMLLDRAALEEIRMLGYHGTYPGVGHAERRGSAYRFVRA